jgi:hypothetical protein
MLRGVPDPFSILHPWRDVGHFIPATIGQQHASVCPVVVVVEVEVVDDVVADVV